MTETAGRGWVFAHVALAVVLVAAFSPWLFRGEDLAPIDVLTEMMLPWRGTNTLPKVHNHYVTDAVSQYIPYRMFAERSFRSDGYIGWNPNCFGGVAQYANTMGLFFDWTMQLHRWLPFWTAWNLGILLQMAVAGWGMLFFLKRVGCSPALALLGAVAFMGNTQFIGWIYHRWALGPFCWFPWVLLSASAWVRSYSPRWFAATAVFVALAFLGGTLQHAAMIVVAVACLWAGAARDAWRSGAGLPEQTRLYWGFAGAGLLAVALSAWMWEATVAAYFENGAAGHERAALGYANGWRQPLLQLASYPLYLMPTLAGSPQTLDLFKAFQSDAFNASFFGTLPALMAVTALFVRRVPTGAKLLMLAGLIIPLTPLVGIFYHRINVLWACGGIWAGCEWLRSVSREGLKRWCRWMALLLTAALLGWLLASVALWFFDTHAVGFLQKMAAGKGQFGLFSEWLAARAAAFPAFVRVWNPVQLLSAVGIVLGMVGLWLHMKGRQALWLLPLGVVAQLGVCWVLWTTWSRPQDSYSSAPLVPEITANLHGGRLMHLGFPGALPLTPFFPNTLDPLNVPTVLGYHSIHPNGMNTAHQGAAVFPGTTLVLHPASLTAPEGFREIAAYEGIALSGNPDAVLAAVATSNVTLPVRPARPTPNTIAIDLPSESQSVQIPENWHRGWQASGDDARPLPIIRAADGSMVVPVPPGLTAIRLRFSPAPPLWVAIVSMAAGVLTVALVVFPRRTRKPC